MKYLRYIIIAVISLAFASCVEEQYAPGEPDLDNCQGFYFPQDGAGDYMLDPSDPTVMEFKAERKNDQGEVAIQVKVSNDSIFKVSEIFFEDGQKTTKFKVDFSAAKTGIKYTCTISVDDPEYVSQYGLESNELTISILRASWKHLGKGLWRDDFMSSGFSCAKPYLETECDVYEREDMPGFYRIENVYTAEYLAELVDGTPATAADWAGYIMEPSILLNATNPAKAYFDLSKLGFTMGQYGEVFIYSYVPEIYGPTIAGEYGSVKDGIITMPKQGVVFELSAYGALLANQTGKFRLVLPGYKAYDYSIDLSSEESSNGTIPVTFELGPDVANVKYAVFEGKVNEVEMFSKVEQIKNNSVPVKSLTKSGTLELTVADLKTTGIYTIVACSYDKDGNYQAYASTYFGFDADGSREVNIKAGLIVSDKYAPEGITSENSMEYYVYGTDITEAKVALYKKSNYEDFKENIQKDVAVNMESLTEIQLDMLNNNGYTGIIEGLSAGTEYVLVVYAKNGYHTKYFDDVVASTTGTFDPLQEAYTFYDIPERLQDAEAKELYIGTSEEGKQWQLWSLDIYEEGAMGRKFRNNVEIYDYFDVYFDEEDNEVTMKDGVYYYEDGTEVPAGVDVSSMDYLRLRGMFPETVSKYGVVNYIDFEYYNGFIYTLVTRMPGVTSNGQSLYPVNMYFYFAQGWGIAIENGAMVGGFTEEGVIAFVANPMAGMNYIAMGLGYFTAADYSGNGSPFPEAHGYPILVSPDSPYAKGEEVPSTLKAPKSCEMLSTALQMGRSNYVETERGYIKSTIDNLQSAPHNYFENAVVTSVKSENAAVDFSANVVESPVSGAKNGSLKDVRLIEAK